ncbi:tyrosine-protein phosphatase [Nocardioides sp. CN2-186]|uniref:tyrosine-protein phosphatase n=1 Tax=Nocardioides tweenelious TaxID=3156607 RepID=UPI0032B3F264
MPEHATSDHALTDDLVRLSSADNFRDVAGPGAGYRTRDGRRVARGIFFRSNELQLTPEDATSLADLGITTIHDLRSTMEIEAHPDVEVDGARWHHVEVSGIPTEMISGLEDADAAVRVMRDVYDAFVRSPEARASYAELLTELATGSVPQLFHCTAGKDRTGWAAALLLEIAGVDRATILADYLLTNQFSSNTRTKYLGLIAEHLGDDKVSVYEPTMVVEESYLATAYATVDELYGSVGGYLTDGLGLAPELVEQLRVRLVD